MGCVVDRLYCKHSELAKTLNFFNCICVFMRWGGYLRRALIFGGHFFQSCGHGEGSVYIVKCCSLICYLTGIVVKRCLEIICCLATKTGY